MPLNQLLHDQQVALIRKADQKSGYDPQLIRSQLVALDRQISAFPSRGQGRSVSAKIAKIDEVLRPITISLRLTPDQAAQIDEWSGHWSVSRAVAIDRLFERGLGTTSLLMRSS